jgi:hypothetical protein
MSDEGRGLFRGLYWADVTRHAVIDIDRESPYHNSEALTKLLHDFSKQGLSLVPYQSSESGGWHLYAFFEDFADSKEVENTLRAWLKFNGYEIKSGTLELFPSGNALRLPLQRGFGWLAADGSIEIAREEVTREQALALFFLDLENNKRNWSEAKERIESEMRSAGSAGAGGAIDRQEVIKNEGFDGLYLRGIDWEKWQRGRDYWRDGLKEKSQRHDAVVCIGHYLWYGDEAAGLRPLPYYKNKAARKALITKCLEEKHNGLSEDVNRGRWNEIEGDIERAVSWSRQPLQIDQPGYEPYPLTERLLKRLEWLYAKTGRLFTVEELAKANIERQMDARERIALAVAQLEAEGSEIDIAKVCRRAKACNKTVAKNRDLLGSKGGVLVAGGLGGSPASLDLACGSAGFSPVLEGSSQGFETSAPAFSGESVQTDLPLFGEVNALEHVCEVASLDSGDKGEPFEIFADFRIASGFSVEGQIPDSEPSKVMHDLTVRLSCESVVTLGEWKAKVAPLLSCLADSQPESPQCQAQALRVPAASLTPGPGLSGIQALRHVAAGGFLVCSGVQEQRTSRGPPI